MQEEDAFLRALRDNPGDDTTRLVYADWLQERGDPDSLARAAYLRVDCELASKRRKRRLVERRRALAGTLDTAWLTLVSKLPIERCAFRFQCPLRWDALRTLPGQDATRFCEQCSQNVHYCTSVEEARDHAALGHCVAVDARLLRRPGDLNPPVFETLMGDLDPTYFQTYGEAGS